MPAAPESNASAPRLGTWPPDTGQVRWGVTALAVVLALVTSGPAPLLGQQLRVGAEAVGVIHYSRRTPEQRERTAVQLIHPVVTARLDWSRWLRTRATVNLEGLTAPDGELAMGAWGEGFIDRRHPHAYVHELLVEADARFECAGVPCGIGGYIGRGFVPFGSDDPMGRAPLRYPVNHHLAQILERAVLGAQLLMGPLMIEAAVFNGDEPESPSQWPRIANRFADSWAARATLSPAGGVELSGSLAAVASPEHRPGAGADQDKVHLGLRIEQPALGGVAVAVGEWARTKELEGFFRYETRLAEISWARPRIRVHYRAEQTDRPEEERLTLYRTARPHLENTLIGQTRWTLHTVGTQVELPTLGNPGSAALLLEMTHGAIRGAAGTAFNVADTYGADRFWSLAVGVRLRWAAPGHAMGRYGLLPGRHTVH
ncbi:MAG: hypothetical protein ACYC2K_13475 [Gemmatimonadales bacterium]